MAANDNEKLGARFVDDDSYAGIVFFLDKQPVPSSQPQPPEQPATRPRRHLPEQYDYYPH